MDATSCLEDDDEDDEALRNGVLVAFVNMWRRVYW
jgi:hypothetical protein